MSRQSAGKIYICRQEAIEGLAFLGVGSADNTISCRFVTGPEYYKILEASLAMWSRSPMGRRAEIFKDFASSPWLAYWGRPHPLVTSKSNFGNWGVPRGSPMN